MPKPAEDAPLYSMTEEKLEKEQNKQNVGRISSQLLAGFIACLSAMSFGTALGWSNPVTSHIFLEEGDALTYKHFAWLVSLAPLGSGIGIVTCTFLMRQMGPKKSLLALASFYILTWWLMLIRTESVQLSGRFFLGFFGIALSICGEALLQQTVHHGVKRYISVFHNSAMYAGVMLCQVTGTVLDEMWLTILCASIPVLHFILLLIVPESPVFLYANNQKRARDSLAWYRGKNNIFSDMAFIRRDYDISRQESDAYQYMFFSKAVYKGVLIVAGITCFQVSSGYFIFLFYSVYMWNNKEVIVSPLLDSTICASYFFISKMLWGSLHAIFPKWKVRHFLISSCFLVALSLGGIATYLFLYSQKIIPKLTLRWIPLVGLATFVFSYDMGLNYYPKILIFEYMPFQVYRQAFSIIHFIFWLLTSVNTFAYAIVCLTIPSWIVFFVAAGISVVGTIFAYVFIVEPQGRSLVEVQLALGGNPVGSRGAFYRLHKLDIE